jgi:GNAT superfamily N-acetyltransferase
LGYTLNPSAPVPLDRIHPISGFDCGNPSLNNWLTKFALQAQGSGSTKTMVVILARLAVAVSSKGKGIRRGMLKDAIRRIILISEQAGIRAVLTRPLDEAAKEFYLRFGFQQSPLREVQLTLILKDAIKFLD